MKPLVYLLAWFHAETRIFLLLILRTVCCCLFFFFHKFLKTEQNKNVSSFVKAGHYTMNSNNVVDSVSNEMVNVMYNTFHYTSLT